MSDPLSTIPALRFAAAVLREQPDEPPASAALAAGALLAPALLVCLGAALSALRVLLGSPVRQILVQSLPGTRAEKAAKGLEPADELGPIAGLLRAASMLTAAALLAPALAPLETGVEIAAWVCAIVLAALLVESCSFLVSRKRGLRVALLVLPIVRLLRVPFQPLLAALRLLARMVGADEEPEGEDALAQDLLKVADRYGRDEILDEAERRMIGHVLDLPETDAAEAMTPRTELCGVEADASMREALRISREEGHSRVVVYEEDVDHIVGVLYVKDVLDAIEEELDLAKLAVRERMRKAYFVPETMRVPALLEELRRRRTQLAVVVDEYGGTAGVVTIEDLLEEIVGDIQDEYDPEDELLFYEESGPDEVVVDGRLNVAELNERFSVHLPEDQEYDTLAGMLFDMLGHIPKPGETLRVDGAILEVAVADDRRITRVRVRRASTDESGSGDPAQSDAA